MNAWAGGLYNRTRFITQRPERINIEIWGWGWPVVYHAQVFDYLVHQQSGERSILRSTFSKHFDTDVNAISRPLLPKRHVVAWACHRPLPKKLYFNSQLWKLLARKKKGLLVSLPHVWKQLAS